MYRPATSPFRIGMLLIPNFNIMAATAFIDPFRAANYLAGRRLYEWQFLGEQHAPVTASNAMKIADVDSIQDLQAPFDVVAVNASWNPEQHRSSALLGWLRGQSRAGAIMGGIDTGAFILGYAGLMAHGPVSVHFEHASGLAETFDEIAPDRGLFVMTDRGFSCSGGEAAADLALTMIREHHGADLAGAAGRYIFHDHIRPGHQTQQDPQREPDGDKRQTVITAAIDLMYASLEQPLSIAEIAQQLSSSQRKLERMFKRHTGMTPVQFYLELRLSNAHRLITQTDMRVLDIAIANGFTSQGHFSRAYKTRFGVAPMVGRRTGRVPFQFRDDVHVPVAGR